MSGLWKWVRAALGWGLLAALQAALFWNAARFAWLEGGVSLRYDRPLDARQIQRAWETARETRTVEALTFWSEQSAPVSANGRETDARLLAVCGDAARLTPQRMCSGAPPAAPGGCAVSSALAWRLWGALDVTGSELTAGERRYSVCGVFEDNALCLTVQSAADGSIPFDKVELRMRGFASSDAALAFARTGGLGVPAHAVNGGALAALARLACRLPLALGALALLVPFVRSLSTRAKKRLACAALLAFALFLPRLLAALPAAWIPTRWSDFAFWNNLAQSAADGVVAWLALPPQSVDVAAKKQLLCQGALCAAGCAAVRGALGSALRYSEGRSRK